MDEAFKTNKLRDSDFFQNYLSGRVLDIGAGSDLVTPLSERFDVEDGDANYIARFRPIESYDAVHSSHCLEHMNNPEAALREWWSLVKPGGYMIIVVPDEDLYEQGFWPSIFNADHKATFTLQEKESWSPVSFNIRKLVEALPNQNIVSIEYQDQNYNYALKSSFPPKYFSTPWIFRAIKRILSLTPCYGGFLEFKVEDFLHRRYNYPIDQTRRLALAQIQIVVKKT